MAKGGRRAHAGMKRKPTAMKVVQGTFRADRHGTEAVIPAKWPDAPAHLNARERELWASLRPHCETWVAASDWPALNGVVSLIDRVLRVQSAQRATDASAGPLAFKFTPSADGEPNIEAKENPLYTLELKVWRELRAYIGLVGLSPADRTRVQKPGGEEKPANPLDRFIKHG